MADPRPLTRQELSSFLPNQRSVRAFEKLFDLIPSQLDSATNDIGSLEISMADALAKANASLQNRLPISIQASNYTTLESEIVICDGKITITLNNTPKDLEKVSVTAKGGAVLIDGNGRNISGKSSIKISQNFTSLDLIYSIDSNEWFIQ